MRGIDMRRLAVRLAALWAAYLLVIPGAAAQEYNFRNISVADGLAQSQVYAMCQDQLGDIWFGTRGGGVSRYDGVTFTTFAEQDGLPNNYVQTILEDRAGNIWIGTDRGVARYDGRRFTTLAGPPGFTESTISAIAQDSTGAMWFGSQQGMLVRYDGRAMHSFTRADGVRGARINTLFADKSGRVWAGTELGASVFNGTRFTSLTAAMGHPVVVVSDIAQDRAGNIWLATYGTGMLRYDGHAITTLGTDSGLSNNTVLTVRADPGGDVWMGTGGGGVNRYNGHGFKVFTETEGLCNNVIVSIMRDSDGDIWFGSSGGGVSRYDGERFIHFTEKQGKLGNWIYAIHQDRSGAMWFGNSSGGVTVYDGRLYTRYSERDGFTAGKVKCIFEDRAGTLWFGTVGNGLFRYDGHTFTRIVPTSAPRAAFINAITQDASGDLWLACADVGVVRYTPGARGTPEHFRSVGAAAGLSSVRIYDILADAGGTIWAATDGAGLFRIRSGPNDSTTCERFTTANGLTSNTIRSLARARDGALLFGTGGGGIGVLVGNGFRSIRKEQGISSNNIYSLLVDGENQIWIGTEKGIDKIVVDSAYRLRSMKHFGKAEGVPGVETTQNGACLDRDGNIWFGTILGAVRYDPRQDRPNTVPPKTHITGIRLFFNRIETTPYADSLTAWYPVPVGLTLPYDQNHLSFDFAGINQRNPEGVRYQWKLEGFDGDWAPLTAERTATYSNLPPGDYRLMVRTFNEDGITAAEPATFSFTIRSPFWERWWFRALALAAIIAIVGGGFRMWVGRIRRENERERKELEMRKNMVELEQKSLRLAMNPHFIFNALNSIQAFIANNNPAVARRYLMKFARLMRSILQNSREEMVPVADEVAMLENYLDLEILNASRPFTYEVIIDPAIDPEGLAIPTMLIQPLVENAVLHGLRAKESGGKILINLSMAGTLLRCGVADNGVGRRRAAELSSEVGQKHVSTAMAVIEERLAIMREQLGVVARIEILDHTGAGGEATGTEAVVYVPVVRM